MVLYCLKQTSIQNMYDTLLSQVRERSEKKFKRNGNFTCQILGFFCLFFTEFCHNTCDLVLRAGFPTRCGICLDSLKKYEELNHHDMHQKTGYTHAQINDSQSTTNDSFSPTFHLCCFEKKTTDALPTGDLSLCRNIFCCPNINIQD